MSKEETRGQMLERLGTDALKWAEEFESKFLTAAIVDQDGTLIGRNGHAVDADLLLGWFANAMCAATDRQTFVQAANIAEGRISYHRHFIDESGVPEAEICMALDCFEQAQKRLTDAQMWFTRGVAIETGVFNPADLEERK